MKAKFEEIRKEGISESLHYFTRKEACFKPYWHYHPEIELTYITQGEGIRYVGDNIEAYGPGDLVLIGRNLPHHWVSSDNAAITINEAVVIQFEAEIAQQFSELDVISSLIEKAAMGIIFPAVNSEILTKIKSFQNLDSAHRLIILFQILLDLSNVKDARQLASQKSVLNADPTKMSRTTTYILENLHQKLTVKELAIYTNLQPESFCRWFKKNQGSTFIHFLNSARIEEACQLLSQTDDKISHIGYTVGFETVVHFNRTFRKLKNITPKDYRNKAVV